MIAATLYAARPIATVLIWSRRVDISATSEKAIVLKISGVSISYRANDVPNRELIAGSPDQHHRSCSQRTSILVLVLCQSQETHNHQADGQSGQANQKELSASDTE
jgi:hypothetical protein